MMKIILIDYDPSLPGISGIFMPPKFEDRSKPYGANK